MSTTKSPRTLCLPAHILDAHISPRAREVLMLLASQTTEQIPMVWVCHVAIAEKLRCSAITVKRAIQKLVEARLIDETGDLHERRYKFYRVKWTLSEKKVAPLAKAKKVVRRVSSCTLRTSHTTESKPEHEPILPPVPTEQISPASPPQRPNLISTADQLSMLKDPTLARCAELAHQRHLEYLRRYNIDPSTLR